jgi:thiol-disulfide isomerase/thioredoxin
LIAYLDQTTGEMQVFHPDGVLAGKIIVPPPAGDRPQAELPGGVRLVNRAGGLRLERLQITRWEGASPSSPTNLPRFELADGTAIFGEISSFDPDSRRFVVRNGEEEHAFDATELLSAALARPSRAEERATSIALQDGTRITGTMKSVREKGLTVDDPNVAELLSIPPSLIVSQTFHEKSRRTALPTPPGRVGRLEIEGQRLSGILADAVATDEARGIAWRPILSRNGSPLRLEASGRIAYRDPAPPPSQQVPTQSIFRIVNGVPQPVVRPASRVPAPVRFGGQPHLVHLVSGDAIPCEVESIDEQGVHIASLVVTADVLPHDKIKAIELDAGAAPPNLVDAKKKRLLTVPRAQKSSPPTHLLCAKSGDFLRCRLIDASDTQVRIEVQLSEIEIPRERISQIIWFQGIETDPEREEVAETAAAEPGPTSSHLVQAIRADGNRITFNAQRAEEQTISGTSDVIGECGVELKHVDQLLFGSAIASAASDLAYHQWRLHPAVEPLVAQDFDENGISAGTASPLVGQAAPEIDLDMAEGGRFSLAQCRGQIVVLDFWASWCGPCMQTMPLTEAAMAEFDPAQVRLVTVNLEEPADAIKAVLARHKLHASVALDIDGVAARRYSAETIPMLVIVDREGKVARVFIGGGRGMVEALKTTLTEMLMPPE